MKTYLISYDLITPGRDYADLYKKIKSYPKWAHPLESVWVLKTTKSAVEIRDDLKVELDSNDKLLVLKLEGEGAWRNLTDKLSAWLKENL